MGHDDPLPAATAGSRGKPSVSELVSGESLVFIEMLYEQFLADPESVDEEWRAFFNEGGLSEGLGRTGPSFAPRSVFNPRQPVGRRRAVLDDLAERQDKVDQLVRGFRVRGHMIADLDPLGMPGPPHPELELAHYELGADDLDTRFSSRTISGSGTMTLRRIYDHLRATYSRRIGAQFMHIDDLRTKEWLQQNLEQPDEKRRHLTRAEQVRILTKLTDAEIFEDFLQKKFLGAKRFSLEGGETLIPLMDNLIDEAAEHGVEEIVIGMAHRGRLNVLANIMEKSARQIFREFQDADPDLNIQRGDVKYHMGHSVDTTTATGKKIHLSLCFNPSHLEFVNPVVVGRVRAKQDRFGDHERRRCMGVLIHGDAAFAGEGVVQETLNMSGLAGYTTGGTIHVIVNNQIGFTTAPERSRTSPYATCVAKMLQIPIFHVNGEDPGAVAQVVKMAMDFRTVFKLDAVIDMYCYRRYGHNEGDDPAYTQPLLYRAIRKRKSVREGYLTNILKLGTLTREECDEIAFRRRQHLEAELLAARDPAFQPKESAPLGGMWAPYCGGPDDRVPAAETGVPADRLQHLLLAQSEVPHDFDPQPKITRLLKVRRSMAAGERPLDWGTAESLAFAEGPSA